MRTLKKSAVKLLATASAVIAQFHRLPYASRVQNIIERVERLDENNVDECLKVTMKAFKQRHRNLETILADNFNQVQKTGGNFSHYSDNRKLLLGAYLTKEYSFQAAALFNPSMVPHPSQSGVKEGEQRFILSLRATGEGHISSIIFRTGLVNSEGEVTLEPSSGYYSVLKKEEAAFFDKGFVAERVAPSEKEGVMNLLPDRFTAAEALSLRATEGKETQASFAIAHVLDTNYDLEPMAQIPLDERLIFPSARCESMGMEDLRLVKFTDKGKSTYYGTYTAYDGRSIKSQLLETTDFEHFKIRTFFGAAINDKGMALFPEKIGGRFAIASRQGSEVLSIMFSDNLHHWETYSLLLEPQFEWEFVQLGNCGSPVKTEQGWLLLTHGVGPMRKYVISAILLDLIDPTIILGRLEHPLLMADEQEREGYVPNVVYTCGLMQHNNLLIIPYAVSDAATVFASVETAEVLAAMKPYRP